MPRKNKSAKAPEGAKPSTGKLATGKPETDEATINPQQFESGREVAAAIAKKYDLAIVGGRLLSGGAETKGASVSLRMFETTMEYLFGKPSTRPAQEEAARPNLVWDIVPPQ